MSEEQGLIPFEVLNRYFEEKLSNTDLYRGGKHSFLKIFQHALSYERNNAHRRILPNYLHLPLWAHRLLLTAKGLRNKLVQRPALKEVVCIDPARITKDDSNGWHSIYMERIADLFDAHVVTKINRKKEARLNCSFTLEDIPRSYSIPDSIELNMLREVSEVAGKTRKTAHWTDIQKQHILSALHIFFDDFRFYYALFKQQPVKSVVFISHYHNEGLLAALEVLKIRSIELQHGLISGNDLYYQYSSVFTDGVRNAFFPNRICVYGPYWKEILMKGCEFSDAQVVVGGDYLWNAAPEEVHEQSSNSVLICAQKNMHADYVAYANQVAVWMKSHPDWKWIIKMHPLEKNKEAYYNLRSLGFEIVDQERPLLSLLRESKIQISIYSTTFFDALGCGTTNYSIQNYGPYKDYAAEMIAEGVAAALSFDEDPIEKFIQAKDSIPQRSREEVYSSFDAVAMRNAIL